MANFTTPRTWSVGELVTKAMLDEQIRDNMNAIWVGTVAGDMDYYSASNAKSRLAKVAGGILYCGASAPAWLATPASLSLLQKASGAGAPSYLAKGNAYEVLRTNSAANAFEFVPLLAKCVVSRSTTMTIGSSETSVLWNQEISDTYAWHNNASNTERITPGVAGDYIAVVMIHVNGGSSDLLKVRIYSNNTDLIGAGRSQVSTGFENYVNVASYVVALGATDYINITADNNGGNTTMQTDSFFQLLRIR